MYILLLQESPSETVLAGAAGDEIGVNPAMGVVPGVVLKDNVGSAPPVGEAPAVGRATVASERGVSVGGGVFVGAARAVCVSCAEICPIAVATAAVLIALTSTVGAGVAPILQAASVSVAASKMSRVGRGNFRTSICVPPGNNGQNKSLEV